MKQLFPGFPDFPAPESHILALVGTIVAMLVLAGGTLTVRSTGAGASPAVKAMARPGTAAAGSPVAPRLRAVTGATALDAELATRGYRLPTSYNLYASRVTAGPEGPAYADFTAGGGALNQDFWPASSIKVLAAVGALELVKSLGFTGAAKVTFAETGDTSTVREIYDAAIRQSSNYDYDLLVKIAGVDWLNGQFLTAANGFPATVLNRSYAGDDVLHSPAMTLQEGVLSRTVPARDGSVDPSCPQGNCSDLFEMTESVRRIVLNDEIPPAERFDIAAADVKGLTSALLGADGFFESPATQVLGSGTRVYNKPGEVSDRDCLDVALIVAPDGRRYLLAASVPEALGGCDALQSLAAAALRVLSR